MTRDELSDRILGLFPPLGNVGDWRWDETGAGEPIDTDRDERVLHRLENGDVLLCGPIPNTRLIGIYRVKPDNRFVLERLDRDPFAVTAAQQAPLN